MRSLTDTDLAVIRRAHATGQRVPMPNAIACPRPTIGDRLLLLGIVDPSGKLTAKGIAAASQVKP